MFQEQLYSTVEYLGKKVGKNYFDFLIEGKVVLELKKGIGREFFSKKFPEKTGFRRRRTLND